MRQWKFREIIVVDDGSTDTTVASAEAFATEGHPIRILKNSGNRGKGYSVRHGMLEAAGEWLLFSDADLSTPIEELEKLYAAVENGAPIAIGSRSLKRSLIGVRQSAFRERAGQLFNFFTRAVLGLNIHDTQCGFKLFRRDAARAIFLRQKLDRFSFDAEVLFIARKLGLYIVEVPVRWNNFEGTKVGIWSGARSFLDLITIRMDAASGSYSFTRTSTQKAEQQASPDSKCIGM